MIWWYMMIYDDLWWFMMIYDDLWWFMMIYDDLWWFMMIYDDLWWFMMIYDDLWWFMMIYDDFLDRKWPDLHYLHCFAAPCGYLSSITIQRHQFQGTQLSRCLIEFPSDTSSRSCDWTNHWQIKSCRTTCAWKTRRLHWRVHLWSPMEIGGHWWFQPPTK